MEVGEQFTAGFGDEQMEQATEDTSLDDLESFGLTQLEMREQARKTGAQIELDISKNLCWKCCKKSKKSELLPLIPTKLPASAKWPA